MRTMVRVLVVGFAAVIVLLAAAAVIGLNNARLIGASSAGLVSDQLVVTSLLREVEREQEVLNAAFYRLSRAPELVDRDRILADLEQTSREVRRLVSEAHGGPDEAVWNRLDRAVFDFTIEALQLLSHGKLPEYSSRDLFFRHEEVTAVVAHLAEVIYARAAETQRSVNRQSALLATESALLVGGCLLVALICAIVTVRIAARVFRQMEAQAGDLSRVSFRMLETQESTARRFSHELHDELGGSLTAIKSNLMALAADASTNRARIEDSMRLVEESISSVRELSQLLRPTILDDFGLDAGIRWLTDRFHERTRIEVDYRSGFDGRLPDETETHLFRIVQEALTNVARHSGATRVAIHLRAADEAIRLTINDNGKGIELGSQHAGMGLTGMRARARSAGGECVLSSQPGNGVTIEVWIPLAKPAAPEKPVLEKK